MQRDTMACLFWYRQEEWVRWKEVVADPEVFEDSFEEWEGQARQTLQKLKEKGILCTKITVSIDEFLDYCRENGLSPDGAARADYASLIGRKHQDN